MKLYMDDDSASPLLAQLLGKAGHDVQIPADIGLSGADDSVHFITGNHDDFLNLHLLVVDLQGHHPGIFVIRKDNDPKRDLTPAGVVRALRNLLTANARVADQCIALNHWR
jgi:hypothetical protein